MQSEFSFYMPGRIIFHADAIQDIRQHVKGDCVLIISDPFLFQSGVARKIGDMLGGIKVEYFHNISPNPSCESVDEATEIGRNAGAQTVIGLGGGSSLDVSKIVSCLLTNEGSVYDYYSGGTRTLSKRQSTLICIPTTAGTGSEVTNVGVFTNNRKGIKMPMVSDEFWPDIALLDPALTYSLPAPVTASTGMDAFCHAIEAYWNENDQPICDNLAIGAMKLILENLKSAYDSPIDQNARASMLLASHLAGIAFSQTRTTGIHAISFPLTTEYGASHGVACSITLPAFIRISTEKKAEKMLALCKDLGYSGVDELADGVEALMLSMNMPTRLNQLGVKEEDISHIAKVGLGAAIIQLTPAVMNESTVTALLRSIL